MFSLKRLRNSRGFTMIELLVVIAVIGVLAVAVLSAINPIEQINKGKDTRARSDAAELLSSVERYYSTQELFPWNVATTTAQGQVPAYDPTAAGAPGVDPNAVFNSNGQWGFLGSLVISNEVKPQFGDRLYMDYNANVAATSDFVVLKDLSTTSDQVRVCFLPTSRQFKLEAARRCCPNLTAGGICSAAGNLAGQQTQNVAGYAICSGNSLTGNATWPADRNLICLP